MLLPNYEELVSFKKQINPTNLNTKRKTASHMFGGHTSLFKGRGLNFSEVREYAPGDDLRAIDWKVTARKGRAHTKIFTEERERCVYVIIDVNSYMEFGTRQTFKSVQAARAAALIAWKAHALNDKTGAILFGHIPEQVKVLPAKRSRKSIWEMLKILCTQGSQNEEVKIEEALTKANKIIPVGSAVFIISDFLNLTHGFEKQFGLLTKRCDVTLIKVSDPADKNIPPSGEIQFSNNSGEKILVNTNNKNGEQYYHRLWEKNEAALTEIVDKFRSRIIKIMTNSDVVSDLYFRRDL